MSNLEFTIRPNLMNALGPAILAWFVRYAIGGVIAYLLVRTLDTLGLVRADARLLFASIATIVLIFTVVSIKYKLVHLHYTRYLFYDTYVAVESGILSRERHSMPYKQISKITNSSSIWDRISNASDMVLHSARPDDVHDLELRSVKGSSDVEHRVYELLGAIKR